MGGGNLSTNPLNEAQQGKGGANSAEKDGRTTPVGASGSAMGGNKSGRNLQRRRGKGDNPSFSIG